MDLENSPIGVARYYSDFLDKFVISVSDHHLYTEINSLGIKPYETDIIMRNDDDEVRLGSYLRKQFKSF
jgi:hypothetical protein